VLGRFADMLLAVEHHPAMLFYLDNQQSIGPDSRAGKRRGRGLNENLAREILELHTLGVGSGYSQTDVTSFAGMLTGWTMAGREGRLGEPGAFVFNANAHQPGEAVLLGKTYADGGMGQAEAALDDIAAFVSGLVESDRAAAGAASSGPVGLLVGRLGDRVGDSASA